MKTYDVIAVTTQPAKPVDAIKLRQFLEPPRPMPRSRAAGAARERVQPRGPGTDGRADTGGRTQPSPLLGVVPHGRGRPQPRDGHGLSDAGRAARRPPRSRDRDRRSTPHSGSLAAPARGAARALPERVRRSNCEHARRVPPSQLPAAGGARPGPASEEAVSQLAHHRDPSLASGPTTPTQTQEAGSPGSVPPTSRRTPPRWSDAASTSRPN